MRSLVGLLRVAGRRWTGTINLLFEMLRGQRCIVPDNFLPSSSFTVSAFNWGMEISDKSDCLAIDAASILCSKADGMADACNLGNN